MAFQLTSPFSFSGENSPTTIWVTVVYLKIQELISPQFDNMISWYDFTTTIFAIIIETYPWIPKKDDFLEKYQGEGVISV